MLWPFANRDRRVREGAIASSREANTALFDRYELGKCVGEGTFGRVFHARDKVLRRDLVIKELRSEFVHDSAVLRRFADDARIAAAIGHPNIVTVFDLLPSGKPRYILMEYMAGGTLRSLLDKRGKLPVPDAVNAALALCRALKAAHSHGVIHRDLKPANIFLGSEGEIKLGDFGIAHLPERSGGSGDTSLDRPHPCTPAYASPEQLLGRELDGRSDLYALGVVLYELVTGKLYFDRRLCQNLVAWAEAVLRQFPIPPRTINPDVPPKLDLIIMRLLEKSPDKRHEDADELIRDLEAVFSPRPTPAPVLEHHGNAPWRSTQSEVRSTAFPRDTKLPIQLSLEISKAVSDGDEDKARELIRKNAALAFASAGFGLEERYRGATLLHVAAGKGHLQLVRLLLESGVDVNANNGHQDTPLHFAATHGYPDVGLELLARGADKDPRNDRGLTPLHLAAMSGRLKFIELLLENGVEVNVLDNKGWTALRRALEGRHNQIADLLRRNGASG